MINKTFKITIILLLIYTNAFSQEKVSIDGVVGIVGKKIITKSDVEDLSAQYKSRDISLASNECKVYEELLFQSLLLNQAAIDSIEVSDSDVKLQLERQIGYIEQRFGSRKKMEDFYNKPYAEIKKKMQEIVKNNILAQKMQSTITAGTKASPKEVVAFFEKLPKDSIPVVESKISYAHIVIYPQIEQSEIDRAKRKLEDYKKQVAEQESDRFGLLASMYSEDPASAEKDGDLGWILRSTVVPEFAEAAFSLTKPGEVSDIIKTEFGYHIIQFLERKGERIHIKHILIIPKVLPEAKIKARKSLDSIAKIIRNGELTFEEAAAKFSEDEDTKNNGGIVVNLYTGDANFESSQLVPTTNNVIKSLNVGEISEPFANYTQKGKSEIKIIKLLKKTTPHVANLKTDYQVISDMTLAGIKEKKVSKWLKDMQKTTFIKISPEYKYCKFRYKGWK